MIDSVPMLEPQLGERSNPWGRAEHDAFQRKLWRAGIGSNRDRDQERQERQFRQRVVLAKWRKANNAGTTIEEEMARIEYKANPKRWEQGWEKMVRGIIDRQAHKEARRKAWHQQGAEMEAMRSRRGSVSLPAIRPPPPRRHSMCAAMPDQRVLAALASVSTAADAGPEAGSLPGVTGRSLPGQTTPRRRRYTITVPPVSTRALDGAAGLAAPLPSPERSHDVARRRSFSCPPPQRPLPPLEP